MNKKRRMEIQKVIDKIEAINGLLEDILSEEQDAFDNMPESLQSSERGEMSEAAQESLEAAIDALGEAIDCLEEIE